MSHTKAGALTGVYKLAFLACFPIRFAVRLFDARVAAASRPGTDTAPRELV